MTERTGCAVVGGGPAGIMLGLLLARAGVEVTVLEKHGDFLRDFRGDTVHPSTLQLLDELGLSEQFARLPHSKVYEVNFPVDEHRDLTFGDLRRLQVRHPYIALMPQWDLLNLLAGAAAREPTFTLRMETEVTGLVRESGRVRGVRYRTRSGTAGEIRADLTVACDGRGSVAHQQPELQPVEYPVPLDVWWFRLSRKAGEDVTAIAPSMRERRFVVLLPREGYFQLGYLGAKGQDARLRAAGIASFQQDIAEVLPSFSDRVDELASMDDVKHLDVRLNQLRRWHVEGLLCIGDAAHAMSPVGGVGINLAIQDAVAAAALLADPLRRGDVTADGLQRVQARRRLPALAIQYLQRFLHRVVIAPVLQGKRTGPPQLAVTLMRYVPQASAIPAYLIGVGPRPEHAPDFARPDARAGSTRPDA